MALKNYTRIPNGGVDRTAAPHASSPDGFYNLLNLRPEIGRLTQVAPVVSKVTLTTLASETDSTVRYIDLARTAAATLRYLVLNEQTARYINPSTLTSQTLIPAITQSKVPNNTTINGQCLLTGYNSTDFAAANDYIEVKITSATEFQWNRNGGSWSASITIATGPNAIGANGLKVYFQATTGFTINDLWRWTRSETLPYSASIGSTKNFSYSAAPYLTDVYLGGIGRNVMRVRDGFITSVGYKRVYGKHVGVYQNHLVVSHFIEGAYHAVDGVSDEFDATTTPFRVGWSDLNNPDNLFATDVNEADIYDIPYNTYPEDINYGITGMGLLGSTYWIYTTDGMSSMDYVGLPNVMQILPRHRVGSVYHNGLVITKYGHYFIGRDNFYFFDGVQPKEIGTGVFKQFTDDVIKLDPTNDNSESVIGFYDLQKAEVSWIYWTSAGQCKQVIYSERLNRWFFRQLPYETANKPRAIGRVYNSSSKLLYGGVQKVNFDYDSNEAVANILKDDLASTSYTQPFCETNDLYYIDLFATKYSSSFYPDASWSSGVSGLRLEVSSRNLLSETVVFETLTSNWTPNTPEGKFSLPRETNRVFRFRMTFVGTLPVGSVLSGWGDVIESATIR